MTRLLEIPNPQRRAIEVIKEVSAEKSCRPFLVGGPVRDLLLGRNGMDVDLTLEDGSSTLARALAKRIEGRVRSREGALPAGAQSVADAARPRAAARRADDLHQAVHLRHRPGRSDRAPGRRRPRGPRS